LWWSLAFVIAGMAVAGHGQSEERLTQVRKLYVASLGQNARAEDTRDRLVRQLQRSRDIEVVSRADQADAVLKGTAQTWKTGHVSLSLRSHSLGYDVFEGFLSVEVVDKNHETLWSYLVTPSHFEWNGITEDLAKQIASRLLADIKGRSQPGEQSTSHAGDQKNHASLNGAGATFPAPLYRKWFEVFEEHHPDVHIVYDVVGSEEGLHRLEVGAVDFAASEMPLSDQRMSETRQSFLHVPIVLGAVVPIYNLPGLQQGLNFTPQMLAGIYLGKIKRWNDQQIRAANRRVSLPNAEIVVIHRSDGSGTSFVWSDYLSKVSPEWKGSVGSGTTVHWPVGVGAEYNEGVASTVQQTPNSLGYVEFIYALQHEISFAAVKNAAGQFIKADIASVTAAARSSSALSSALRGSITDPPGKASYPIATYTWIVLPTRFEDRNKGAVLAELLHWMLNSGQKSCSSLGYAPLPTDVAQRALRSLDQIIK
jgi:phosphate ABC transporter phosphate-binding protein